MTDLSPPEPFDPASVTAKVGMYWRTSNRFNAPHHPTVLTLDGGRLTAVTDGGRVLFDAPVTALVGRFTVWGTLILTLDSEAYRFVAGSYAGAFARPFTADQEHEIAEFETAMNKPGTRFIAAVFGMTGGRIVTTVTSGAAQAAGYAGRAVAVATMFSEQRDAFRYSRHWADVLTHAGAGVEFTTRSYGRSVATATVIVVVGFALLGVAVFAIVSAASG